MGITGSVSGTLKGKERREMNTKLKEYFTDIQETKNTLNKKTRRNNGNQQNEKAEFGEVNDDENDDHLENIFECIRPRKGLNLHPMLVADLMKGYLMNGQYHQCINIFDFCVRE